MSSSAEPRASRPRHRRWPWVALALVVAGASFRWLPQELKASLREIAMYAAIGTPLLLLAMFKLLPYSVFPGHDDSPSGPTRRSGDLTAGWPRKRE